MEAGVTKKALVYWRHCGVARINPTIKQWNGSRCRWLGVLLSLSSILLSLARLPFTLRAKRLIDSQSIRCAGRYSFSCTLPLSILLVRSHLETKMQQSCSYILLFVM